MRGIENICIIGAGNIGTAMAVDLSLHDDVKVTVLTSRAEILQDGFAKIDSDTGEMTRGRNIFVTADYSTALDGCDLLIVTVPSFLTGEVMRKTEQHKPKRILFVPGYGGKEFFCKKLISAGCVVAGLDRVTYVARLVEPNVVRTSKKKETRHLACVDGSHTASMCAEMERLLGIKCSPAKNYLTITLTPSNPILHTARLYSMFRDKDFSSPIERQIKFYGEWTDDSSEMIFEMDGELQAVCRAFPGIDLSGVVSLPEHYESRSVSALTKKISSIPSFQSLLSPLRSEGGRYFMDSSSRYFKEDFMYGLCNLKGFALIAGVSTPAMDRVLRWYERISGNAFFDAQGDFNGASVKDTGIPQNFGIRTKDDVCEFYTGGGIIM